jgi:hypothetical protein
MIGKLMATNLLNDDQKALISNAVNSKGGSNDPPFEYYDAKASNVNALLLEVFVPSKDDYFWKKEPVGRRDKDWLTDDAELLHVTEQALDALIKDIAASR